ncbi:MAG: methyltransferase, partial [Bacteroidia bacterium]|nr:methyltransferase [Bacteroidia bacterium]
MSVFQFKQFNVLQARSSMKVGTDSVVLGCLCEVDTAKQVLDIGTGTGLLSLMVAQRNSNCTIDAVEINADAATEAKQNINNSKWN